MSFRTLARSGPVATSTLISSFNETSVPGNVVNLLDNGFHNLAHIPGWVICARPELLSPAGSAGKLGPQDFTWTPTIVVHSIFALPSSSSPPSSSDYEP